MTTAPTDFDVMDGCVMVGHRNPDSLLQCNTYLRRFASGQRDFHWCVDPGSRIDFGVIRAKIERRIGSLDAIDMVSLNHQDPDVVGNLGHLTAANSHLTGLMSEDVWRLVRHLDATPHKLTFTEQFTRNLGKLPSGHRIQLVPTPFCHFRGAVAFYDPELAVLFSGDLFGGLNRPGEQHLWATESDWAGVAAFHQIYMPARSAIRYAVRQIRALSPAVQVIAPQHGFLLRGDIMHKFLDQLEELPVGLDCLADELDERNLAGYQEVFDELLHHAAMQLGRMEVRQRLKDLPRHHELWQCLTIHGDTIELTSRGIRAIPLLVELLASGEFDTFHTMLRSQALQGCVLRKLPIPPMAVGVGERGHQSLSTPDGDLETTTTGL